MRLFIYFVVTFLLTNFILISSAESQDFIDVSKKHKNYQAISILAQKEIIQGYPDNSFQPNNIINRAEAVKLLITTQFSSQQINNALEKHKEQGHSYINFYDIKIKDWFAPYIELAYYNDILQGYPDGSFRPGKPLNFAEGLKIILNTSEINLEEVVFRKKPLLFVKKQDWFAPYFTYAYSKNLINRTKFYHPAQFITRGEFVEILYRIKFIQENNLNQFISEEATISNEFRVTIPRLNIINIPINFADPYNEKKSLEVLKKGLGHYLNTPGSEQKIVLFGHSSGYSWDDSAYKYILKEINKIKEKDYIYINYQEQGFVYQVYKTEIISAKQDSTIIKNNNINELVLYTCWPPDKITHRYIVYGLPL